MNGIVIVDKPQGWTSQDVTARLRRVFNTRRIGHGGTLDPMATGVLPVFVGRATRGVEFFEHAEKVYETVLRPGITTDTEDITGTVLTHCEVSVSEAEVEAVLPQFRGQILQVPPMYSALKVNGQKLYDLARKGKEVERQPRPITIHELTLLKVDADGIHLRVRCSKGTYIRTLCKDIGQALGCGGCMAALRRVQAGEYTIEEAVPLETLLEKTLQGFRMEGIFLKGVIRELDALRIVKEWELFLLELLAQKGPVPKQPRTRPEKNYETIVRVLENNVSQNLTIQEIARLCSMSPVSVKQTFARYAGLGLMNYYNRLKIQAAAVMLREGASVQETAAALGFSSQNYFSTVFKRIQGLSPTAYKNQINER